ncbi:5-methyltetrahydropteroyltriglutamate--homocysteine S-methyltransferase, partial [Streptococcus suis]|nr:5-methyltetrahydropteroyltriglutamate--homocysteine S-methyltransferase [Streptococcus suis]
MTTTIIGFPRIGEHRELKFITEKYFRNEIPQEELLEAAKDLRAKHWNIVKEAGINEIPSNDFSHYDNVLDAAVLFNIVPKAVQNLDLTDLEKYFALARGYQGEKGDVRARPMKKWFNTNYHYIVPAIEKDTEIKLAGHKIFDEFQEAKGLGITTRPVLIGPFTLLQLTDFEEGLTASDFADSLVAAYGQVFEKLAELGAEKIQLDEPSLVKDLTAEEKALFLRIYQTLLADKKGLQVLIQTYFGDVRDIYTELTSLPVDAIGLDFVEGKETAALVATGFPADKTLYAGIVNGKNIWRNNYEKSLAVLEAIPAENIVLTTSCSLLHVPFTTANEVFEPAILNHFAFAVEKLSELRDLDAIRNG